MNTTHINNTETSLTSIKTKIEQQNFEIIDLVKVISTSLTKPPVNFCGMVIGNSKTEKKSLWDILYIPNTLCIDIAIIYIRNNNKTKEIENVLWNTSADPCSITDAMKRAKYKYYDYFQLLCQSIYKGCEISIHYYVKYTNGYRLEFYNFDENHELLYGQEWEVKPSASYLKESLT